MQATTEEEAAGWLWRGLRLEQDRINDGGKEAIGGRCGRVEWRFVQQRARGTACRHGRGGTSGSNNRVVRTLYPGGTEMADNGDGAEDDAAAMEETREMGNNGEGKRMAAIIGGRGEEE